MSIHQYIFKINALKPFVINNKNYQHSTSDFVTLHKKRRKLSRGGNGGIRGKQWRGQKWEYEWVMKQ